MNDNNIYNRLYQLGTNHYLFIGIVFLLMLIPTLTNQTLSYDEGIWNYIGQVWVKYDIPPYQSAVENKTPGIFYIFSISNWLFGMNIWFPRILGVTALTICALFLYKLVLNIYNHLAGIFTLMIFGLTMSWRLLAGQVASYTESFMIMFTVLGFYFLFRAIQNRKSKNNFICLFISGLIFGISISFKQVALFSVMASIIILFKTDISYKTMKTHFLKNCIILIIGMTTSMILILIPLFLNHVSLKMYWNGAWLILLQRGSSSMEMLTRAEGFIRIFKQSPMILFYPLLFLFMVQKKELLHRNMPYSFILIWIFLDFIGVNASGAYFHHQIKQLIPSLAVASGIAITTIIQTKIADRFQQKKWIVNTLIIIILLWFPNISAKGIEDYFKPPQQVYYQLGMFIKENTSPNDYVYILGGNEPEILVYSERRSSSRYINSIFIEKRGAMDELSTDLKINTPQWILVHSEIVSVIDPVKALISQSYEYQSTVYGYKIFKRKYNLESYSVE